MDLGIAGRKALVAGGSAGMGKASALALAREGVELVISARGEERLFATARDIAAETGVKVTPVVADHGSAEGRARLLRACPDPDILVMTFAPPRMLGSFRDIDEAEWMAALGTTFVGPVELMKATVDGMAARGFGRIVNIGTAAAKYPLEIRLLSGPSRAALCNYSVALARRFASSHVAINTILPGMFHTATMKEMFEAAAAANGTSYAIETQKWIDDWRIPAGRFGEAADVGAFCAMLCSAHASYLVGQSLVIDGGLINGVF
jgi:3-oxoacyl-[acyl-carrier protein] reductase